MATLRGDLERLLNSHSAESNSNTPDFILAEFLMRSLEVWDCCVKERDKYFGRQEDPAQPIEV
jgi:hypothetical protein